MLLEADDLVQYYSVSKCGNQCDGWMIIPCSTVLGYVIVS